MMFRQFLLEQAAAYLEREYAVFVRPPSKPKVLIPAVDDASA
jgi:hypothetical protein